MTFEKVRLADCCTIKPPKSEARKLLSDEDSVSFVSMHNLGINEKQLFLSEDRALSEVSGSYTYFAENDVLLAKITPCFENGKLGIATGLTNGVGFGSSEFIVFRSKGNVDPHYLYYYLLQPSFREAGQAVMTGAVGHKRVPNDFIENTEIPLPPLPEQKRIVTILDQAFADIEQARAKTEQNLKNARELFESYLQQVFSDGDEGWGFYQLSELCELISGQHIDAKDYNFDQKGIGYLTGPSDFGHLNPIVTKWTEHPKRTAASGDILITVKGSGVGKINIMNENELAISRQLMAVRPTGANGEILYWFLSMQFNYFQSLANGAAIPGISRSDVLDLKLSIPSTDAQPLLANSIRELKIKVADLEKIYQQKLISLDELKNPSSKKPSLASSLIKKAKKVAA